MPLYPNQTTTMKHNKIFIAVCLLLYLPIMTVAQEEETDDLGTQEVTVVRSYNPSLKSVFKIRTNPEIEDSLVKKQIKEKKMKFKKLEMSGFKSFFDKIISI